VLLDALVGEVDYLGDSDTQEVEGYGEGDDVEVAYGDYGLVVEQNERVVARRVELDLHRAAGVGVGVVASAVGLGHAPEGERVLQVARRAWTPQVATFEQLPQPVSRPRLARVGPHPGRLGVDGRKVRPVGFQGERRGNVEGVEKVGHVGEDQRAVTHRDPVGAYERETLLRFQVHGLESRRPQGLRAGQPAILVVGLSTSDQDLPDLRHLGQVGLSHGAPGANNGMDPGVQGVEESLDELGPHPHAALGHAVRPRGHHRAHDAGVQFGTLVRGVAGDQAHGELLQVLEGDTVAGK
jgi:hypothetical protein